MGENEGFLFYFFFSFFLFSLYFFLLKDSKGESLGKVKIRIKFTGKLSKKIKGKLGKKLKKGYVVKLKKNGELILKLKYNQVKRYMGINCF